MRREPDLPSLVVGAGLVAIGALLLLDALDVVHFGAAAVWPALLALVGAALVAGGVRDRRRSRNR